MKKLFLLIAILVIGAGQLAAQSVTPSSEYSSKYQKTLYGLKDTRTGKWVVSPNYLAVDKLGSYQGVYYYGLMNHDRLWGIVSSKDFSKMKVSHQFNEIQRGTMQSSGVPVILVRKGANWGGIELYTDQCQYVFDLKYSSQVIGGNLALKRFDNKWDNYSWAEVQSKFNAVLNKQKQAELDIVAIEAARRAKQMEEEWKAKQLEEERRAKQLEEERKAKQLEEEKRQRQLKEARLASFTEYAKNYVTPVINSWQIKGEFEKIADYQARVTGENRTKKIEELTKKAEDLFIKEHETLEPLKDMRLQVYDAENEVFSINSAKFGQLLIPVPIEEGASFKNDFYAMVKSDAEYFIQDDKLALRSLVFTHPTTKKSYKYSNAASLNYSQYKIDADSFGFDSIQIPSTSGTRPVSSTSTQSSVVTISAPSSTNTVKPTCKILSPYVTIRYLVNVGNGLTYKLRVSVNGEDIEPEYLSENSKGVKVAQGKEMSIKVPRKQGEPCIISMYAIDSEGLLGEPQKLRLHYVGEQPKPKLHLFAVGVSDYSSKDLSPLSYASKDAEDFIKTINGLNTDLYSEVSNTLLVNKNATRNNVLRDLKKLVSNVDQRDVVMLYFSGHGIKDGEDTFFMTSDSSAEDTFTAVNFSEIKTRIRTLIDDMKCHVVLFMDTCHSGAMYGMKGSTQEISMKIPELVGFYSSTSGQQSAELDKLQNGAFTHAILNALKGGAKNANGEITINNLEAYVKKSVKEQTNNRQDPIIENKLGDAVLFKIK